MHGGQIDEPCAIAHSARRFMCSKMDSLGKNKAQNYCQGAKAASQTEVHSTVNTQSLYTKSSDIFLKQNHISH